MTTCVMSTTFCTVAGRCVMQATMLQATRRPACESAPESAASPIATSATAASQCWPHSINSADFRAGRVPETGVIAQAFAGCVTGIDERVRGQAHRVGQRQTFGGVARERNRGAGSSISADRAGDQPCRRTAAARARRSSRVTRAGVAASRQAVEVFHAARFEGLRGIKRVVASTLANATESRARGVRLAVSLHSSASAVMAPQTSLPCTSAFTHMQTGARAGERPDIREPGIALGPAAYIEERSVSMRAHTTTAPAGRRLFCGFVGLGVCRRRMS